MKKLTTEAFSRLLTAAGDRIPSDKTIPLTNQFHEVKDFTPPQTHSAWLTATNVSGRLYGTKSRGDRLQAVDRAYKAWIEYTGPEGIAHGGNAENLRNALETYAGTIYRMTGPVSGMSRDYRDERNRDGVITKTLVLADLLTKLCLTSPEADLQKRQADRRAMLNLVANIKVEMKSVTAIIGAVSGIGGIAAGVDGLLPQGLAKDIVRICEGSVATAGAIGGGIYGVVVTDDIPGKIKAFLVEQWNKFKEWMRSILALQFGIEDVADLIGRAGQAFALVVKVAMESIAKVAAGASDIYDGLKSMISDAWKRHTLTLQQAELVTSEGAFAMIRNGIDTGIRNRQIVAAWTIAKGVTTTVVSATATEVASRIAGLVLTAFEFIFKIIYKIVEKVRIEGFMAEARVMWSKLRATGMPPLPVTRPRSNAVTSFTRPRSNAITSATPAPVLPAEPSVVIPKATTGSMPAFKAAHYSASDFINDSKAAYLNFLYSLVDASPVLAAIVMNSGAFKDVSDVLHAATPRSTEDAGRAAQHIKSLQIEAVRLYNESGFEVVSHTTAMSDEENLVFQPLFNAARLAPAA